MRYLLFLSLIPSLTLAQPKPSSAVNQQGTSNINLSAPRYTSTAASGANGFACATNGCRLDLGTGSNDYLISDGTDILVGSGAAALTASALRATSGVFFTNAATSSSLRGSIVDGASACGVKITNLNALANATAGPLCVYSDNASTLIAKVYADGSMASATEFTLTTWWFNAAAATGACPATGTGCIAHILPARAFTVVGITSEASVASGGGAANTVITITDGTNTCTATIPCNQAPPAGTSAAGPIRIATANGAGTGCVYAASATLTASVTTAGCTTSQPTLRNIDFLGKWQ